MDADLIEKLLGLGAALGGLRWAVSRMERDIGELRAEVSRLQHALLAGLERVEASQADLRERLGATEERSRANLVRLERLERRD